MLRTRLSKLLFAAGLLAAVGGCSGLSNNCLTSHFKKHPAPDCACVETGACPVGEGPMLQDFGPYNSPTIAAPIPYQGPMPQPGVPQLSPLPQNRLEPYPQPMAPAEPYTPTKKSR